MSDLRDLYPTPQPEMETPVKTFIGHREPSENGERGEARVVVHEPGKASRPLDPRLDLRRHSPDGFEWGYAGSGPSQLSLALAAEVLNDDERALRVYQRLKFDVIGLLPLEGWTLTSDQLLVIVNDIERDRNERSE